MVPMRKNASIRDMKITYHGQFRMAERENITTKTERQQIAYNARYKGEKLTSGECMKRGWSLNIHSSKLYMIYKDCVFVFVGKNRRTLATVIPMAA
jgi:hypothetical protein